VALAATGGAKPRRGVGVVGDHHHGGWGNGTVSCWTSNERHIRYEQYRGKMLSGVGFAVFVAGNKFQDGRVQPAGGIRNEYDISRRLGVLPIPVGATGHVSEELWREVRADPVSIYGNDRAVPLLDRLAPGCSDVPDVVDAVFAIIQLYDGRRR
jgi:hypothetical protein